MMQNQHQSPILPILVWLSKNWTVIQFKAFSKEKALKVSAIFLILYGTSLNGCSLYVSGVDIPEPVQIVESQTNILLSELSQRKDEFDAKPQKLIHFAKNIALSHWDIRRASSFMLGKYWFRATVQHQNQFKDAFLKTLMRYVVKAYGYYDDSLVKVVSYDWQPRKKGGWVKSIVRLPAGLKVSVDYRMMKNQQEQWKLVDVRVEGISLIGAKRKEYRGLIHSSGMTELLKSMVAKNAEVLDNS